MDSSDLDFCKTQTMSIRSQEIYSAIICWIGEYCEDCKKQIDESDIEEFLENEEDVVVLTNHDPQEAPRCYGCYIEHFEGISDFKGDYNLFHPDETEEEYSDHEDNEVND